MSSTGANVIKIFIFGSSTPPHTGTTPIGHVRFWTKREASEAHAQSRFQSPTGNQTQTQEVKRHIVLITSQKSFYITQSRVSNKAFMSTAS